MFRTGFLVLVCVLLATVPVVASAQDASTPAPETPATETEAGVPNGTGTATPTVGAGGAGAGATGVGAGGVGIGVPGTEPQTDACNDLGPIETMTCNGGVGLLRGIGRSAGAFYGDITEGAVELLVNRPRTMTNGEPSVTGRPDNAEGQVIHDLWWERGLPAGLLVWAMFMILNTGASAIPFMPGSSYARGRAFAEGWVTLGFILASGLLIRFMLIFAHGLNMWVVPTGSELGGGDIQVAAGNGAAALFGALLTWFVTGAVAVIAAVEYPLMYIALFIIAPFVPLAMALTLPSFWLFNYIARAAEGVLQLFTIAVFWTLPSAVVLGAGYPVATALAEAVPDLLAFIPGIGTSTTAVFGFIILLVWVLAVLAPPIVFTIGPNPPTMMAMTAGIAGGLSAGALSGSGAGAASGSATGSASGAASSGASSLASSASSTASSLMPGSGGGSGGSPGTPTSGGSSGMPSPSLVADGGIVDPVSGSSFSPDTTSSHPTDAVSSADTAGGTLAGTDTDSLNAAPGPSGSSGTAPTETVVDAGRRYEFGYETDDGFQRVAPHSVSGEWLSEGGLDTLAETNHLGDHTVQLKDAQTGDLLARDDFESTTNER